MGANILTCRFATLAAHQWRPLMPAVRRANRALCEARDWRSRKTLMLLARYAQSRGRRAAAVRWARRAVAAAAGIPTRHGIEDAAYLRTLETAALPAAPIAAD